MSETDDTDELILIPPDFFDTGDLEEPYLYGPYYNVVDSLISQVSSLESRINCIENKSLSCTRSNSISYPISVNPKVELMSGVRKYNSSDDINKVTREVYFESTQSTPQKPQTRFKLSSCSSTSTERYSPQKRNSFSPKRINKNSGQLREPQQNYKQNNEATKEILQEIDQYISNIQTNSKENDKSNKYQDTSDASSKNSLNLKDLEYMLRKVDLQNKEFESGCLNRNLPKRDCKYDDYRRSSTFKQKSPASSNKNHEQIPSTSDISTYSESFNDKCESRSSSSSESTQLTALPNNNRLTAGGDYSYGSAMANVNNSSNVQTQYFNGNVRSPPKRERNTRRKILQQEFPAENRQNNKIDHRLMSLSNLWNRAARTDDYMSKEEKLIQKLEEEKLRRQHCEQLIQHLQCKTLELQEKLAVAVQVDEAKDDAILRFHSSWEQVAQRLQTLTQERNDLEQEIEKMQSHNAENTVEMTKKISHFENETSKALSLAQASQERVRELENQISELTTEMHTLNTKIENQNVIYKNEIEKNSNLSEQLQRKNVELNQTNEALSMVKAEIANSKRAIEVCQVELTTIRTQNSHLEMIVNEKDDIIKSMERHNQKLLNEIDTHKKVEKDLQQELNKAKEAGEKNKLDLRNFYQDQVEIVVRDKLREFQSQLDRAESSLQEELKKRELTIAKSAATHIQQIAEKHSIEIKLLEEKHGEEVKLYQMKLSQAQQFIENLQSKLNIQHQKKSDMAKQLHRVMEAQWIEALKIINNGRSPIIPNDQDVTINQLNVLKTKSHSNLEEVLSMDEMDGQGDGNGGIKPEPTVIPPLNLGASSSSVHEEIYDNCPYTFNMDTPLSSRLKSKQQIESELQKYVQLLLNKQPGNPTNDATKKQKNNAVQEIPTWQPISLDEKPMPKVKEKKGKKAWK